MALVRFDPVRGFENVAKRMNDFISGFDKGLNIDFGGFSPRVDITEDEKNLFVYVELPGVRKEDVKVTINDENVLIIKGEKKKEEKTKEPGDENTFIRVERNYGSFTRSFMLPENINRDSINAKYEHGVLFISLSKIEPKKPKEVEVQIL